MRTEEPVDNVFSPLVNSPILASFSSRELQVLSEHLDIVTFPVGRAVVHQGDDGHDMYFLLAGEAHLQRNQLTLRPLTPGDYFGELSLISGKPRAASLIAATPLTLARLTEGRFSDLIIQQPQLALKFLQNIVSLLGEKLADMTDNVGLLLRERSLPRRSEVQITLDGIKQWVKTGSTVAHLLPGEVNGHLVVAGLLDHKAVSLHTSLTADASLSALTTAHWEGWRIYRRSISLLLLEAAFRLHPHLKLQLGHSLGFAQVVNVSGQLPPDLGALAEQISTEMQVLISHDLPYRHELWAIEEACARFHEQGWESAAHLLRMWRLANVSMVSCGQLYALSMGPLLSTTGMIKGFQLRPYGDRLLIHFGDDGLPSAEKKDEGGAVTADEGFLQNGYDRWMHLLGTTSVGSFNDLCISGKVSQTIRVSEGSHEKRIGQIADMIISRRDKLKVICIAGPSSSGKTTFIKRLSVHLQINAIIPMPISLDDYYVDREKTVKNEDGELDFEALEALRLDLLSDHLSRLVAGETVKTARYDFLNGLSIPDGGPEITLNENSLLILEGIHGLNPRLLGNILQPDQIFRVFIMPMTTLPFDCLSSLNASDLRLLRRIVRDRHQRGCNAADNIMRWPSVRMGERLHILPYLNQADVTFDSALVYEPSVLKVFAERYLLEVPQDHPAHVTAYRLRQLIDRFVTIYPDHVPPTSIIREFIGGSGFEY